MRCRDLPFDGGSFVDLVKDGMIIASAGIEATLRAAIGIADVKLANRFGWLLLLFSLNFLLLPYLAQCRIYVKHYLFFLS